MSCRALAGQAATWEVNPTIDAEFLEAERERDPDLYRGEYGAEFLDSGGAYIPWEEIQAAVADHNELSPGLDLIAPVAAVDPAFQTDPFTVSVVGHHPIERRRLRVALVRSWRPARGRELSVEDVLSEVAAICRRYGITRVFTDQFASAAIRQSLQRRGLTAREITMSASSKTAIYGELKAKILAGELEIPRHDDLIGELGRIEAHYSAGSASVRIPRRGGSHGDLAQAVALGVYAMRHRSARNKQQVRSGTYEGTRYHRPQPITNRRPR